MKWILVLLLSCSIIFVVGCGDNCTLPTQPDISLVADDDAPGETVIPDYITRWEDGYKYWDFGRECGGEGWRQVPDRYNPCSDVNFYAVTNSDGKTSICCDGDPCSELNQEDINSMYRWAIGTPAIPSD
jgi:hypothetical protein